MTYTHYSRTVVYNLSARHFNEQQTSHCLENEKISPFTQAPYITLKLARLPKQVVVQNRNRYAQDVILIIHRALRSRISQFNHLFFSIYGDARQSDLPYGCNFWNRNKLGGGVRRGGRGIYTDSAEYILSDDAFKAHVYPSVIYNQHMLLITQPLTPT